MGRVAIVTDSAADLPADRAAAAGITIVPLEVTFGSERLLAGVDLTVDAFWQRMVAPDSPFPTTAAASPGQFQAAFEAAFAGGADAVVCVDVAEGLSATIKSARIARDLMADREIHVVNSRSASMGVGILAELGAEMAAGELRGQVKVLEGQLDRAHRNSKWLKARLKAPLRRVKGILRGA